MLRLQVSIAFLAVLVLVALSAVYTFWSMDRAHAYVQRGEAADKTLDGYIELMALSEQLLRTIADASFAKRVTPAQAESLRTQVLGKVKLIRAHVTDETAGMEKRESELNVERNELSTLAFLESNLRQAFAVLDMAIKGAVSPDQAWASGMELLGEVTGDGHRHQLEWLIEDERDQVAHAVATAEAAISRLRAGAVAYGLVCCLLLAALASYFFARIRKPFTALMEGTRVMAQGDISARVTAPHSDEFALIAANINAIAAEREARRAALLAQQGMLETTVRTRTEELRLAMARLNDTDRLRRQLFADISHELRTPLTAIRGEAEIALRRKDEAAAYYHAALTRVIDISGQFARLIEDLLFISRADAGSHRMNMSVVNLNTLLQSVCAQAKALAYGQHLDANIVLDDCDPRVTVFADYDRLHQLFIILADNAICYSQDQVDIRIAYRILDELVTVTVADRGAGIPEAELQTIFLRFHRGADAGHRNREGLGLGLPIAKAIAEAHGGDIRIESTPNEGTTVSVTLVAARHLRGLA
jgi:two-component system, OmpR family, sensor kinase